MNRIECVERFAQVRNGALVIVSPGFTGHELHAAEHDDATLYNMDMGLSAPMCLGLALACPDVRVVALEGDGSMLMSLPTLTTIARYQPRNLVVVVFDNGRYVTTGRGAVASATAYGADLAALARAAGIAESVEVREPDAFGTAIARAMTTDGPWVVVARVDTSDRSDPRARGGFDADIVEQAVLFQRALRERAIVRKR